MLVVDRSAGFNESGVVTVLVREEREVGYVRRAKEVVWEKERRRDGLKGRGEWEVRLLGDGEE